MLKYLSLLALGGCYMEAGLGGSTTGATAHGSMGLIVHFGESGSVRAGAGGGIGPFEPSTGDNGALSTLPADIGAEVRIVGNRWDSLVASVDFQPPISGELHVPDFDASEPATTFRGFAGLGYHHDWWQVPKSPDHQNEAARVGGSVTTALGAELWYGASKSVVRDSSTRMAMAMSLMIEIRGWLLFEALECASSTKCE